MRIMARCSSKASIVVQTAQHVREQAISWKRIRMAEQMQCRQTPIDTADAQVFGEVVFELVSALLCMFGVSHALKRPYRL